MGKEKAPRTEIGLWIDHKEAIIVALTGGGVHTSHIASGSGKGIRHSGSGHSRNPGGPKETTSEDGRDRKHENTLNAFYDEVVAAVRHAESIQIFGPGEAKGELEKRLARGGLGGRIINVETVDKMTRPQIAAKVRKHFAGKGPARGSRPRDRTRSAGGRGQARPPRTGEAGE